MSTKKLQIIDYNIKQAENADTVDGKHASDFAAADDVSDLQIKVGDTAVSEQISTAISEIDYPVDSVNGKTGVVMLTANDVGALPVDTEIPSISGLATETYVDSKVAGIVDSAPETLNTLNELSAALGDDPNFATTIATQIGGKVDKVNGKGLSTNDYTTGEKNKLAGIDAGANKTIIDSALSSTSTNPVQNKVVNTAISNLNALVGDTAVSTQIDNAIASIDAATTNDIATAVDSIEIGGRNLLLNTQTFSDASSTTLSGALLSGAAGLISETYRDLSVRGGVISDSQLVVCRYGFKNFDLGETFTFSFFARGNVPEIRVYFYGETGYVQVAKCVNSQGETNTNVDGRCSFTVTEGWKRYWVKWTLKTTGDISVPKWVMVRTNGATSGQTVYVCGCKLEKGNKITDWSPSPEDLATADHTHSDYLPFIAGTQTAATGSWTGNASSILSLFDGLTIRYWLPYAVSGNATLNLTLADGTTTGAIPCYYGGTTRLTTHYGAGNIITLTYRENVTIAGSETIYTGWWADANYDSGNNKVSITTTNPSSSSSPYYIPFSSSVGSTGTGLLANDGLRLYSLQGTDSTLGYDIFVLGNSTSINTAGNKYGAIRLYSQSAYYGVVTPMGDGGLSANRTWAFPDKTMTVSGTSSYITGSISSTTSSTTKAINITNSYYQVCVLGLDSDGSLNTNPLSGSHHYSSGVCPKGTAYSGIAKVGESTKITVSATAAGIVTITLECINSTSTIPVTYYVVQFD